MKDCFFPARLSDCRGSTKIFTSIKDHEMMPPTQVSAGQNKVCLPARCSENGGLRLIGEVLIGGKPATYSRFT